MTSGVQLLDSNYINKVNPAQVEAWVKEGKVIKQGGQFYVAGSNIATFPESCFVKDGDNVKTFKVDRKGTIVEKTTPQQTGEVVGTPTKTYSVPTSMLIERMGIQDDGLKAEFLKFIGSQQNLAVDQDGNINFDSTNKTALNDALKAFAEAHKENFVNPDADKYVEFTKDSAPEIIDKLGKDGAIENAGGRYAVRNEDALRATLNQQVGDIGYEASDARSAKVEAGLTTTTTTKEGIVDVPDDLRGNRSARKELKNNAADAYADMVANADQQTRDAIDLYIAERKYNKQIDKKMAEMLKDKVNNRTNSSADIIQLYIDKYTTPEDRDKLNKLVSALENSSNPNDQEAIKKALEDEKVLEGNFTSSGTKRDGALIAIAKQQGIEPNSLLRIMATYEVMKNRSTEQVIKDDKYFIEHQAKDFVKNQQVQQDVPNTTVYFSKKGRKDAPEDGKIHTDIGKKGRELVKSCPEMLCDEITDPAQFKDDEDNGYFTTTIEGKKRCFKFSQDKWKTFMKICCDPSSATDAEMALIFKNNKEKENNFLPDRNLTLQESRQILSGKLSKLCEDGKYKLTQFSQIIGNSDTAVNNRELNALRDMAESAGYSVDKNTTSGKRLLHVLKSAGLGFGAGFLTGGLGSLLSGPVKAAGTTAAQMVDYSGKTADRTYSGTTDAQVITDKTTFKYSSNGEEFSKTVTKNITVDGQDWSVTAEGQEYKGQVQADGQDYSTREEQHLKNGLNAGLLGAIAGAGHGLGTMGGVQERGRNTDDVFNLTRLVSKSEQSDETLSLEIPQFTTVEKRSCEMEIGQDIPKLKVVPYRGPEAYNGLYRYEDGTPVNPRDFAKAYKNQVGGDMTFRNFFVYPELTVPGKGKIVPVDDFEAEYKKIKPGTRTGTPPREVHINPQGKKKVSAQGTIKS